MGQIEIPVPNARFAWSSLPLERGVPYGAGGVVVSDCRKRLFTTQDFMDHLADDMLPSLALVRETVISIGSGFQTQTYSIPQGSAS